MPNFSWITPNNCSDAHDTTCKGNNLSGAFGLYTSGPHAGQVNLNDPLYTAADGLPANPYDPEATTPRNFTGGLYASDLFLAYYLPLIETSQAYQDGGLVDITFDEGEASFTYSGNSFNNVLTNSTASVGTPAQPAGQGTSSPQSSAPADAPTYGTGSSSAPGGQPSTAPTASPPVPPVRTSTGPTSTTSRSAPTRRSRPTGAGTSSTRDRATTSRSTAPRPAPTSPADAGRLRAGHPPGCLRVLAGSQDRLGHRRKRDQHHHLPDPKLGQPKPRGHRHRAGGHLHRHGWYDLHLRHRPYTTQFPNGLYVGTVSDTGALYPNVSGGPTVAANFQAIDSSGNPVTLPGSVTSVTLSAEVDPATAGGVDHGRSAVGCHRPDAGRWRHGERADQQVHQAGHLDHVNYNHYSWLRTMEDLFNVSSCASTANDVSITYPAGRRSAVVSTARATSVMPPSPAWCPSGPTCSPRPTAVDSTHRPSRPTPERARRRLRWPSPCPPSASSSSVATWSCGAVGWGVLLDDRRGHSRRVTYRRVGPKGPALRASIQDLAHRRPRRRYCSPCSAGGSTSSWPSRRWTPPIRSPGCPNSSSTNPSTVHRRERLPTRHSRSRVTTSRRGRRASLPSPWSTARWSRVRGSPWVQRYTTCTWTISLSHVRGHACPSALTDWDSIDHSQTIYKPFLVPGQ